MQLSSQVFNQRRNGSGNDASHSDNHFPRAFAFGFCTAQIGNLFLEVGNLSLEFVEIGFRIGEAFLRQPSPMLPSLPPCGQCPAAGPGAWSCHDPRNHVGSRKPGGNDLHTVAGELVARTAVDAAAINPGTVVFGPLIASTDNLDAERNKVGSA